MLAFVLPPTCLVVSRHGTERCEPTQASQPASSSITPMQGAIHYDLKKPIVLAASYHHTTVKIFLNLSALLKPFEGHPQ
jgi:hypothetical protein